MAASARIPIHTRTKRREKGSSRDATGRSRLVHASLSRSSRRLDGSLNSGPSTNGAKPSTRVYLNGLDVTPQSLLVGRIKPPPPAGTTFTGHFGPNSPSRPLRTTEPSSGVSVGPSPFFERHASFRSSDLDSDSESSSSCVDPPPMLHTERQDATKASLNVHATVHSSEGQRATRTPTLASVHAEEPCHEEARHDRNSTTASSVMPNGGHPSMLVSGPIRHQGVTAKLRETTTAMLVEQRSVCVALEAQDYQRDPARGWTVHKKGTTSVHGRTQTVPRAQKAKEVMTAAPATRDAASSATKWDIYDSRMQEQDEKRAERDTAPGYAAAWTKGDGGTLTHLQLRSQVQEIVNATLVSPGCVLTVDGEIVADLHAHKHRASRLRRKGRGYTRPKTRLFDSSSSAVLRTVDQSGSSSTVSMGPPDPRRHSRRASQDVAGRNGPDGASSSSVAASSQVHWSKTTASRAASGRRHDSEVDSVYARADTTVDLSARIACQRTSYVLQSSSLLCIAKIVERAVQQNVYHDQQVKYRGVVAEERTGPTAASGPPRDWNVPNALPHDTLERLWTFRCALTRNRSVLCLAWNTAKEDVLAVSYSPSGWTPPPVDVPVGSAPTCVVRPGQTTWPTTQSTSGTTILEHEGLVLFWSLANPEYPERIYRLPVTATSMAFSLAHPYLLALGFADGLVSVYDTRKITESPVPGSTRATPVASVMTSTSPCVPIPMATTAGTRGRHLGTVWQVTWVQLKARECVISVSADGRIVEWSLTKGLSSRDLMTLDRVSTPCLGGGRSDATSGLSEGVLSRQARAQCLAFARPDDPSVYHVGTEDGLVHKCSVSYTNQSLQTYWGHSGPVYHLCVSPFCHDVFLSCAGDWSLKVWHQREAHDRHDVLTLRSVDRTRAIVGASWSPSDAGVVAAVAEDGRIEVWDVCQSTLDPLVGHDPHPDDRAGHTYDGTADESERRHTTRAYTTVAFAPTAPVFTVGDSAGDVAVYRVPAQVALGTMWTQEACNAVAYREEQAAKLRRTMRAHKDEG